MLHWKIAQAIVGGFSYYNCSRTMQSETGREPERIITHYTQPFALPTCPSLTQFSFTLVVGVARRFCIAKKTGHKFPCLFFLFSGSVVYLIQMKVL